METISRSNRYHIGIFGRRNAGKSTLLNALTGQDVSIVSDVAGTTTDTVWKNIELPGIGAAVIADTAGFDDIGELGNMRNERTKRASQQVDMAIILVTGKPDDASFEIEWRDFFKKAEIPTIFVLTKCDADTDSDPWSQIIGQEVLPISALNGKGIEILLAKMASLYKHDDNLDDITYSLVDPRINFDKM